MAEGWCRSLFAKEGKEFVGLSYVPVTKQTTLIQKLTECHPPESLEALSFVSWPKSCVSQDIILLMGHKAEEIGEEAN